MTIGAAQQFFLGASKATGGGGAGYQIERSLRFNSSDSAYLSRTPASAGNRKTWTWSGWVKRSELGTFQRIISNGDSGLTSGFFFQFNDTNTITLFDYTSSAAVWSITTNQVFRDVSSWYHIALAYDTTQATASERIKLYVNGGQVTAFSSASYPSQNYDGYWNGLVSGNTLHTIGRTGSSVSFYLSGYLADIHFIDGQALTPSSFTEVSATTGQLIPKAYTGSFNVGAGAVNGFWLKFSDNSAATATTLGKDYSGNSNNWTPNNLSVTAGAGNDSLVDTPTSAGTDTGVGGEVTGNYATLNPLAKGTTQVLANGNLDVLAPSGHGTTNATIAATAGLKVYMEFTRTGGTDGGGWGFTSNLTPYSGYPGSASNLWWVYDNGGNFVYENNGTQTQYASKTTNGQTLQLAIDYDAGKAWIGINNTWFTTSNATTGNPSTGANPTFTFTTSLPLFPLVESVGWTVACNFGQRQWAYAAPAGFKALCDTNLTAPVIAKSSDYFQTVLYTGNGSTQTVSGLSFSPDFVWLKMRSASDRNILTDIVRGVTNTLNSDSTRDEATATEPNQVTAYTSSGFTVGSNSNVNGTGSSFVAWAWDAGTTTTTNTQGSITSSVRANASAGFSVVSYTGNGSNATVGHGLGAAPRLIIARPRGAVSNWIVYHASEGAGKFLRLNTTDASITDSTAWNNTAPTSTVYSVGNNAANGSGLSIIAYCFAPVAGYSSFGSYTGNGSTDGPFVYTGFRPRWIMIKCSSLSGGSSNWIIQDTSRDASNSMDKILLPNLANGDITDAEYKIDTLSNGFKVRNSNSNWNASSATYVYAAFAENPFQYARAR